MSIIGEAIIAIRPDTEEFKAKVHSALAGVAGVAAGVLGAAGVVDFFKSSVQAALDLEEATSRLNLALKNVGESTAQAKSQADGFLNHLRDLSGFTKNDLTNALSKATIGTGHLVTGERNVALAADIARVRHKDLGETLAVVQKISAGSVGSIHRLGIAFTPLTPATDNVKRRIIELTAALQNATGPQKQALKDALAHVKAHEAYAKAADKATAATQALQLLQRRFAGGAADFASTTAGKMALFHNSLITIETTIGTALLPELAHLATVGTAYLDKIEKKGPAIAKAIQQAAGEIGHYLGVIGGAALSAASHLGGIAISIKTIVLGLAVFKTTSVVVQTIAGAFALYAEAAKSAAEGQTLLDVAVDAFGPQIIITAIAAIAIGLYQLYERSSTVRNAVHAALAFIQTTATAVGAYFQARFGPLIQRVFAEAGKAAHNLAAFFVREWPAISKIAQSVGNIVVRVFSALVSAAKAVAAFFVREWPTISNAFSDVKAVIQDFVKYFEARILPTITNVVLAIVAVFNDFRAQSSPIFSQIASAVTAALHIIETVIRTSLTIALFVWNHFHGVVLAEAKATWNLIKGVVPNALNTILDAINVFADLLRGRWGKAWSDLKRLVVDAFHTMKAAILGTIGGFISVGTALAEATVHALADGITGLGGWILGQVESLGSDIVDGITNGVKSAAGRLASAVTGAVSGAISAASHFLHINSPSTVARDVLGKPIVEGVIVGVQQLAPKLAAALTGGFRDAVNQAKQNLGSLAGTLSGTINTLLDAQLAKSPAAQALARAQARQAQLDFAQQLQDARLAVAQTVIGTQEHAKAEADLAVLIAQHTYDAQAAKVEAVKAANTQTLADLADALNRGLISQKTYQARVVALLKREGVNYKAAGSALGLAFADGFIAQLTDMLKQAAFVVRSGLPGSGLGGTAQNPIQTLKDDLKTARQALKQAEQDAKSTSGPGGAKVTKAEAHTIAEDKRQVRLLREALKALDRIHIENLNVTATGGASGDAIAEQILLALGGALA